MNKILIIGSCGAGKSTLALAFSQRLNLPLISLDRYYWRPGWARPDQEDWRNQVTELVKLDQWIMEGNYQSTFDLRFPASDTIIILDINRFVCLWRVVKRRLLKNRVDQLADCAEKIDFELIKWVLWGYPSRGRKEIFRLLKKYRDKKIVIIKSNRDLRKLDNSLFPTRPRISMDKIL